MGQSLRLSGDHLLQSLLRGTLPSQQLLSSLRGSPEQIPPVSGLPHPHPEILPGPRTSLAGVPPETCQPPSGHPALHHPLTQRANLGAFPRAQGPRHGDTECPVLGPFTSTHRNSLKFTLRERT